MTSGGGKGAVAAVLAAVVLGLTACAGSSDDEEYPLAEQTQPDRRTVTTPEGGVVSLPIPPTATEVEPSPTCERVHASSPTGPQTLVIPPAPGLRATAITTRTTKLEWWFDELPDDCRPVSLILAVSDVSSPRSSPTTERVEVAGTSGSVEIVYPEFLPPPNVASAAAYSSDGSSRTSQVRVARDEDTPADPPEAAPPVVAPAGEPVVCDGTARAVSDVSGDVLTYAPGKSPTRVRTLTPALAGIDVILASIQVDGSTVCARLDFARPPEGDFSVRLSLVDTTTFACCASLFFKRTAGNLELGQESMDSQGDRTFEPVEDGGAALEGSTLRMTGTLPDEAWDQPDPPAVEDIAWSLTANRSKSRYGPYFGDWVPRHEPIGQPFVRQGDGAIVPLGPRR